MDLGIRGKNVLITGASQGIGLACALAFAAEGCRVAITARREPALRAAVERMGGSKAGHRFAAVDLMAPNAATEAAARLSDGDAPFDIVVHNLGGTLDLKDPLAPSEAWNKVWRFNVGVAIDMNAVLIPPMIERKWGRVVHISSISAESLRGSAPYGAAKAYLNAYVKGLGRAVAPSGVIVSAVMPGAIWSEGGHWDRMRKERPEVEPDFLRHHHAIGRLGTAEEIAPAVLFLASQHVTFAPATIVPIDGGTM
jgi:3-oxoacyl-[acyl-carrier protein] reductase